MMQLIKYCVLHIISRNTTSTTRLYVALWLGWSYYWPWLGGIELLSLIISYSINCNLICTYSVIFMMHFSLIPTITHVTSFPSDPTNTSMHQLDITTYLWYLDRFINAYQVPVSYNIHKQIHTYTINIMNIFSQDPQNYSINMKYYFIGPFWITGKDVIRTRLLHSWPYVNFVIKSYTFSFGSIFSVFDSPIAPDSCTAWSQM